MRSEIHSAFRIQNSALMFMPFNPNFPPDHQDLNAAPFRDQYNALKALYDAQQLQIAALTARVQALESGKASMDDVNAAIVANSSANCDSVEQLDLQPSDPPTQNDVYQTVYRVNVLIGTLHRQG